MTGMTAQKTYGKCMTALTTVAIALDDCVCTLYNVIMSIQARPYGVSQLLGKAPYTFHT